jgi:multidrug transporter EmrE-like cation transporter
MSWGYAILSALFHVGYNLLLVRTYRSGDLGQTYPIARGSSPLLVSIGAALFAGELPDPISMVGVLLVSGGIISLAFQGRRLGLDSLAYALGTGCFIGAYSVTDGIGVRLAGTPRELGRARPSKVGPNSTNRSESCCRRALRARASPSRAGWTRSSLIDGTF